MLSRLRSRRLATGDLASAWSCRAALEGAFSHVNSRRNDIKHIIVQPTESLNLSDLYLASTMYRMGNVGYAVS